MTAPEYRTQIKRWFVETGFCDGNGVGYWDKTEESVEAASKADAEELRDKWLVEGKLERTHWGELRPKSPYGLFRIRSTWEDVSDHPDPAAIREAALREAADVADGVDVSGTLAPKAKIVATIIALIEKEPKE